MSVIEVILRLIILFIQHGNVNIYGENYGISTVEYNDWRNEIEIS